jgi:hypothetical protein
MMRYLILLLKFGWFKHVEVYALISGHIHKNIFGVVLNSASIFGILLFYKFPNVINMFKLLDSQILDVNLI